MLVLLATAHCVVMVKFVFIFFVVSFCTSHITTTISKQVCSMILHLQLRRLMY